MAATIGILGTGAMGAALAAAWRAGGAEVVADLSARSPRSRALAAAAGISDVPAVEVVRADVVVSVVPPGSALAAARTVAAAAAAAGVRPVVADLNAVSPPTLARIAAALPGHELVDGALSGPPPAPGGTTRLYLAGPSAPVLAALPAPGVEVVVLDGPAGSASALKMCTASMYKGTTALVTQAMLTARHHGVLEPFLADVAHRWPHDVPRWPADVGLAASKAARFADEMREIAATQHTAGLPPGLFDGAGDVYARIAATPAAARSPEEARGTGADLADLAARPRGVLFDFSGTLFRIESPAQALLAALGPGFVPLADGLERLGAINGATEPQELPDHLAGDWDGRDLSMAAHRAVYSGLAVHGGLSEQQAAVLYERGVQPEAWLPYDGTVATLRALRRGGVRVAIVSNIGWDPRPVLARYGVDDLVDELVLSYELGVMKPDPVIFEHACSALGLEPDDCVMVGDSPRADGGSEAIGVPFRHVAADPHERGPDALLHAAAAAR
ncbi:HAD-IA family hydrolase [Jatrophihabitans fulvus]